MKNKKAEKLDLTKENEEIAKHYPDKVRTPRDFQQEKINWCLSILDNERDIGKRVAAIHRLVYAFDTLIWLERRKYTEAEATRLISLLGKYAGNDVIDNYIGCYLLKQGANCEGRSDYENALRFYESSFCNKITEEQNLHYWRLNNTAYCLNHFGQYEKAEKLLRQAVELLPEQYNAWKNLGVSLEHTERIGEAAECYVKAIQLSRGEERSIAHLEGLVERQPYLSMRSDISAVLRKGREMGPGLHN